jgi:N-formylglutamate deformylase
MTFELHRGRSPLLVSFPHSGTEIPPDIRRRLTHMGRDVPDTDWHVPQLYDFVRALGAGTIKARVSRYVVDLNRPPDDATLYPGQIKTGLCPTETFDGVAVYRPGLAPTPDEIAERVERFWRPYHAALQGELDRLRAAHGVALLWDGHSIRSVLPRLFEGRLPDLNLGTNKGKSCARDLRARLAAKLTAESGFTRVADGRFVGGYITRHYGRPAEAVHAVQMELVQACYMDEHPPWTYEPQKASRLKPLLRELIGTMLNWASARG